MITTFRSALRRALPIAAVCAFGAMPAGAAASTSLGGEQTSPTVDLTLPLVTDTAGLKAFATAVSTPGSPSYGHYLSIAELSQRFGATQKTRARVVHYLRAHGATGVKVDATGQLAEATMRRSVAEHLFRGHVTGLAARATAAANGESTPGGLSGAVTGVVGLTSRSLRTNTPVARPHQVAAGATGSAMRRSGTPAGCAGAVGTGGLTPNQYNTAYGIDPLHAAGLYGQGQRIAMVEISGFKRTDIQAFASCFGLTVPPITRHLLNSKSPLRPDGEPTLDLELAIAAAPLVSGIDVYETRATTSAMLRAFAAPMQASVKPSVISSSIGLCEQDTAASLGHAGLNAAESEFQVAVAAGITIVSASGDNGSADCIRSGHSVRTLAVDYPGSSWWVTSVGGTNVALSPDNHLVQEVTWNDGPGVYRGAAGGGGPSQVFIRPSYQDGVVQTESRVVPDVSMMSDPLPGYAVYCSAVGSCVRSKRSNPWGPVGGTSAAAPLLAGGLALVDQSLANAGKAKLGFVNPLFYKLGAAATPGVFNDVTLLGNEVGPLLRGSRAPLGCCTAVPGYDAATGWGSVNLAALSTTALTQ